MSDLFYKYNWLRMAFAEQVDRINECFYFDRRNNELYSVFITDFCLIDEHSKADYPNNPYSEKELTLLKERIDRQVNKDSSILPLPRLTVEERKQMMQNFLDLHRDIINRESLQLIIDKEDGRTNLSFNNLLDFKTNENWKRFKSEFIRDKIDSFFNLHNIDVETASLWTENKMTTMDLDLTDNKKSKSPTSSKPWWKLW